MIKYQEEPSLLEVRQWREQCRLERRQLTDEEYLKKRKEVSARWKAEYPLHSPTVVLPCRRQRLDNWCSVSNRYHTLYRCPPRFCWSMEKR